eukprot:gene350-380_t
MSELVETVLVEEEREEEGEEKEIQRAILSSSHDDELIQVLKRYRNWISVQKEVITVHLDEEFYHFLDNRIRSSSNEQLQLEIAYWYALLIALPNFNGTFPAAVKHILEAAVASTENYEMVENTLDIILMTIGKNKNFNLYTGEIITILLNQGRSSQSSVIKGKILGIFSKLCWGYFQNAPDTLPFIFQCLNSSDSLLIACAAEALSAFTESSDHQIDEILSADSTLPNRLAELLLKFVRQYPDKSKEEHVREVYRIYDVVNKLKFGDNRIPSISHLDNFVNGI